MCHAACHMEAVLEDVLLRAIATRRTECALLSVLLSLFDGALASTHPEPKILAISQIIATSVTLKASLSVAMQALHGRNGQVATPKVAGEPMLDTTILLCFLGFLCSSAERPLQFQHQSSSALEQALRFWLPRSVATRSDAAVSQMLGHQQQKRTCVSVHMLLRCLKALWKPHFSMSGIGGAIRDVNATCSRMQLSWCSSNASVDAEHFCCAQSIWASYAQAITRWALQENHPNAARAPVVDKDHGAVTTDHCSSYQPALSTAIANPVADRCMLEPATYATAATLYSGSALLQSILQDLNTVEKLINASFTPADQTVARNACCNIHASMSWLQAECPAILRDDLIERVVEVFFRVLQFLLPRGIPKKLLGSLLWTLALCTRGVAAGSGCWMKRSPPFRRTIARACRYLIESRVSQEAACLLYFPLLSESLADNGVATLRAAAAGESTASPYAQFLVAYPHLIHVFAISTVDACLREMADCSVLVARDIRKCIREGKPFLHGWIASHVIEAAFWKVPAADALQLNAQQACIVVLMLESLLLVLNMLRLLHRDDHQAAVLNCISNFVASTPGLVDWYQGPVAADIEQRRTRCHRMLGRACLEFSRSVFDDLLRHQLTHFLGVNVSKAYASSTSGKKRNWSSAIGRKRNPVVAMWQKEDRARGEYEDLEDFIVE